MHLSIDDNDYGILMDNEVNAEIWKKKLLKFGTFILKFGTFFIELTMWNSYSIIFKFDYEWSML